MYGTVQRVKILYNKKDTALVQYADSMQAHNGTEKISSVVAYFLKYAVNKRIIE